LTTSSTFIPVTNGGAPNSKLVSCQISASNAEEVSHPSHLKGACPEFKDFVPEDPKAKLSSASLINDDKLLLVYSRDVKDELWQFDWKSGKKLERKLPDRKFATRTNLNLRKDGTNEAC